MNENEILLNAYKSVVEWANKYGEDAAIGFCKARITGLERRISEDKKKLGSILDMVERGNP